MVGAKLSTHDGNYEVTCKKCGTVLYNSNCKNGANFVLALAQGMAKTSNYKPRAKGKAKSNIECECKKFYSRCKVNGTVVCTCVKCGAELYIAPNYVKYRYWASSYDKIEVYLEDNQAIPSGGLNRR
jgi:hypothetical protein